MRLCRARATLEDLDRETTVASLAATSRLSRSHFIARYRAAFGDTPHQTRIKARVERARALLATSELSVTQICMAVGFSSLGSFSQLFRARCGESPQRYRNRMTALADSERVVRLAPHCLMLLGAAWGAAPDFPRSTGPDEGLESDAHSPGGSHASHQARSPIR